MQRLETPGSEPDRVLLAIPGRSERIATVMGSWTTQPLSIELNSRHHPPAHKVPRTVDGRRRTRLPFAA